jgi:outer membrane protein assembly complex protein YaeT
MKIILALMMVMLLPAAAAAADEAIPEQFELSAVKFDGLESVSKSDLARTLAARMPPFWKFWLPRPVLSDRDIEEDRLRIEQFYRNNGYYQTAVEVRVTVDGPQPKRGTKRILAPEEGAAGSAVRSNEQLARVSVTFFITEGPPVLIASVDVSIDGTLDGIGRPALLAGTGLEIGQVFKVDQYEAAKENIGRALGRHGHPFAEVTGRAAIDPKLNQAKVYYKAAPGPLCSFGPTTISQEGPAVSEAVIRRALTYRKGERYDVEKVDTSRRNLFKLDVFRTAIVKPEGPPSDGDGVVPMKAQLRSKDRQSVRLGVGYGTQDKLRLQAGWTFRNLAGQGGLLTLSARVSDIVKNIELAYDQPYFLDARNTLSALAGNELDEPPAYTNRRIYSGIALNRRLGHDWYALLRYDLSFNTEESVAADDLLDTEEELFLDESTRISAFGMEAARDTRNDLFDPRSGSLLGAKVAIAPDFLGSELAYFQPAVDVRKFLSVYKDVVLAGRVYVQTIKGIQGSTFIPAFKRLYLGGSDTVRGYAYQELPPLDSGGNPIGGQSAFNASVEARFPIYKALSGVTFLDTGLLDTDPFRLNFSDMRYTCGIGLRYDTVIGPIRVDLGYKINPPTGKDIGDAVNPDEIIGDRWRLYINIGQAF